MRVQVRTIDREYLGECWLLKKKSFLIRIQVGLDKLTTRESLIHEWAHCVSWSAGPKGKDDHDAHWGIAFAACYRALLRKRG